MNPLPKTRKNPDFSGHFMACFSVWALFEAIFSIFSLNPCRQGLG